MEVDLEDAMDLAGTGKYQVLHCALMVACLGTALLEMISYQFTLTAAACDLQLTASLRGLLTSAPNIGIILTAPFWGRVADRRGRKSVLVLSAGACACFGLLAAFMPGLVGFAVCKFLGAFFMSIPSSLPFAYAGELVPRRRRDLAVLACNGLLTLSSVLSPLFAWAVLSKEWLFQLGSLTMRPWRLLTIVYALPLLLTAVWLSRVHESPKFLMSKGRKEEALDVLKHIYATNTGMAKEKFSVLSLKNSAEENNSTTEANGGASEPASESTWLLLRPPYLKWFTLLSFLMFGLYVALNGLFLFSSDTINTVLAEPSSGGQTLCKIMNQPKNETSSEECSDTISQSALITMVVTTLVYGILVLIASVLPLRKKTLLVGMFITTGIACLIAVLLTNLLVAGAAMSALQITALGIGPITAYAVQIFPTRVRGTAVSAVIMCGRVGSVVGANVSSALLPVACSLLFYGVGGLELICAALSFLLPKDQSHPRTLKNRDDDNRQEPLNG